MLFAPLAQSPLTGAAAETAADSVLEAVMRLGGSDRLFRRAEKLTLGRRPPAAGIPVCRVSPSESPLRRTRRQAMSALP